MKNRKKQEHINFKMIFNDQRIVLITTGLFSFVVAVTYYLLTIIPYAQSIEFWNTTLFFDSYTLMIILWFISILMIHVLTDPDKYHKYLNLD